ncbi:phosphoadenylyl-sulfate reductase [Oryzihumus leptocrescens]|uniref:Adenosine 5'-phosphosulfate reductase n=1 Tax=Oryzihumus leptocrescens TaxID=297536 RepID=A0A542ZNZ2_9MICO|nr:phosphoadenylyl-sulfate reductase [Oryzihumus leptocrescens]TQL61969.1 phosphoadenosine phosphosulfate reductase [Oryzihumus leptocrescens]
MTTPTTTALDWSALTPDQRDEAIAEANERLEGAPVAEVVRWTIEQFGQDVLVASSMQDTILPHMFAEALPGVQVLFLQTGYHFTETLQTRDEAAGRLPITVVEALPRQTVAEQDEEYGERLHDRDPNLCCFLRKVEPLARALEGHAAWVTGVRRVDAPTRAATPVVSWDDKHDLVKVNPLVAWTDDDVEAYQAEHDLPRNPLVAQGYPSIGCGPCTHKVAPGADPRSGRWSGKDKTECGIHT